MAGAGAGSSLSTSGSFDTASGRAATALPIASTLIWSAPYLTFLRT